jgi:hypothetical protein
LNSLAKRGQDDTAKSLVVGKSEHNRQLINGW